MTRVVYVNGRYAPYAEATVHVEDRGFQFADSVYEVCEVRDGRLVDERRHMQRLSRSLSELKIGEPMDLRSLGVILRETVRRNRVTNGIVYLQVTRGVARRDFAFPAPAAAPGIICFARSLSRGKGDKKAAAGISVITVPDIRWKRVDIKTTGLLGQALARQQRERGGRGRGLDGGRARLHHRGRFLQRLDRNKRWHSGDATGGVLVSSEG